MTLSDRRTEERLPAPMVPASVASGVGLLFPRDVTLLDLSRNGVSFETTDRLIIGENYFLNLRLPGRTIQAEIDVRWCEPARAVHTTGGELRLVYRAGASFAGGGRRAVGVWEGLRARRQH